MGVSGGGARLRSIEDLRVLVVEDDSFTRKLVLRLLQDLHVREAWEAADGVAALEVLRRQGGAVDVAICDLEMPRMSGLDLLHALRTSTGNPLSNLPVIVLTTHSEAKTVKQTIAYGISGYLVKPVSKADLVKRLTFAIQQAR